jgi:SAM-dependent methyltransferase
MLRDLAQVFRISGLNGAVQLARGSRRLKTYTRGFALMHALIALEKCGLVNVLLTDEGLDPSSHEELDTRVLSTICEYMHDVGVLTRSSSGVYTAHRKDEFASMVEAMYASYAYHEPIQDMHRLLTKEHRYGQEVVRNDKYDAIASAALTSLFSYRFSHSVLKRHGARGLLDVGCGTGEYLLFLSRNNFAGALYGIDISEEAIAEGTARGVESAGVTLLAGDVFDLKSVAQSVGSGQIDVISFMFVLHEFETSEIRDILIDIRHTYPAARILLTELIRQAADGRRHRRNTALPELTFVHGLSRQILRTPAEWEELLSASGFSLVTRSTNDLTNHVCMLFAAN